MLNFFQFFSIFLTTGTSNIKSKIKYESAFFFIIIYYREEKGRGAYYTLMCIIRYQLWYCNILRKHKTYFDCAYIFS